MNWEAAVEIYIEVLQNPRATAGTVIGAKEDLRRLARNADELKAHVGKLSEAIDKATLPEDLKRRLRQPGRKEDMQ